MRSTLFCLLSASLFVVACGKKTTLEVPQYTEMKNINEAPPSLQTAARAIFKLNLGNSEGTGTFLSRDGLILTNNHVLGVEKAQCAREGCHLEIFRDFQIGLRYRGAESVYAVPVSLSPEWDASVFQLFTDESKKTKVTSEYALAFAPKTGAELKDTKLNVIGHPLGSVKKWVTGSVYRLNGDWFSATAFGLPGSSGSPFLDDEGRIVALLHRGTFGHNQLTRKQLLTTSIGTPAALVQTVVNAPRNLDLFHSVQEAHTQKDVVDNEDVYLRAHVKEATLKDGSRRPVLDLLGEACDEGLNAKLRSPDDAAEKLSACSRALGWINCNDKTDGASYKACPAVDKAKWNDRFKKAAEKYRAFSSQTAIDIASSVARLEETKESARTVVRTQMSNFFTRSPQPLSFELAVRWIVAFGAFEKYGDVSPRFYITEYQKQPNYEFQYGAIIHGHIELANQGVLNGGELGTAFGTFFDDEKLDLGNKLGLEEVAYRAGYFD